MKNKYIKNISLSLLPLIILSCSNQINTEGFLKLNFKEAVKNGFSTKVIPETTEKFEIIITGEGLSEARKSEVSKDTAKESVLIEKLPTGEKEITVNAKNKEDKVLASGSAKTKIETGKLATVTIELKDQNGLPAGVVKFTLNNYPSDAGIVMTEIQPETGDLLNSEFTSKEFEIKDLPQQNLKVKVTVLNNDFTPLAFSNFTLDPRKENKHTVSLETIKIPDDTNIELLTTALPATPSELFEILNKVIIKFKKNNAPQLDKIIVNVNSKVKEITLSELPFITPICINKGDNVTVEVKYKDLDNDKVKFFWASTSPSDDSDRRFKMKVQPERDNIYKRNVDLGIGRHFLGFIMTDRKSVKGPFTVPFRVRVVPCL